MKTVNLVLYRNLITEVKVHETVWNRIGYELRMPVDNQLNEVCYLMMISVKYKLGMQDESQR